jgi:hypothetical protein
MYVYYRICMEDIFLLDLINKSYFSFFKLNITRYQKCSLMPYSNQYILVRGILELIYLLSDAFQHNNFHFEELINAKPHF